MLWIKNYFDQVSLRKLGFIGAKLHRAFVPSEYIPMSNIRPSEEHSTDIYKAAKWKVLQSYSQVTKIAWLKTESMIVR